MCSAGRRRSFRAGSSQKGPDDFGPLPIDVLCENRSWPRHDAAGLLRRSVADGDFIHVQEDGTVPVGDAVHSGDLEPIGSRRLPPEVVRSTLLLLDGEKRGPAVKSDRDGGDRCRPWCLAGLVRFAVSQGDLRGGPVQVAVSPCAAEEAWLRLIDKRGVGPLGVSRSRYRDQYADRKCADCQLALPTSLLRTRLDSALSHDAPLRLKRLSAACVAPKVGAAEFLHQSVKLMRQAV